MSGFLFQAPWGALALFGVPALVLIYVLRQRAKRRRVSSLLLWRELEEEREGGRTVERFRAPPLFWLELLAILLLALAAAGPLVPTPENRRPLVVVLDDSYSMRAGAGRRESGSRDSGGTSPLAAAREALEQELESPRHLETTFILAGEHPRRLAAATSAPAVLDGWQARAPTSDLDAALELAIGLGGERARLLVVTDRAPDEEIREPRLAWWAFGRPRPNLAIVHAVRSASSPQGDGVLLEVANFSRNPATARLDIRFDGSEATAGSERLELAPGAVGRARFDVPSERTLRAGLVADVLTVDDEVVLLPEKERQVRVRNEVGDPSLRQLVDEALLATGRATVVTGDAELVVNDDGAAATGSVWTFHLAGGAAKPYLGPFVLDHGHPLTEGLSLQGVIWGAGREDAGETARLESIVVAAGDVPLVVDRESDSVHDVTVHFRSDLSNLQQTPNWPILWWNLLSWRASTAPGLERHNFRLSDTVAFAAEAGVDTVRWRRPAGHESELGVTAGRVELLAADLGVHGVFPQGEGARRNESFAVNALAAAESDLRRAVSGRWGDWDAPGAGTPRAQWDYRPFSWLAALLALTVLVVHLALTSRAGRMA